MFESIPHNVEAYEWDGTTNTGSWPAFMLTMLSEGRLRFYQDGVSSRNLKLIFRPSIASLPEREIPAALAPRVITQRVDVLDDVKDWTPNDFDSNYVEI